MQHKTQAAYEELFSAIDRRCSALGCQPDPTVIITDFEISAMRAVVDIFGQNVSTHGCFFHLNQCTWRKIQELGLSGLYRSDENFRLFCGILSALAFVPLPDVTLAMQQLKLVAPPSAQQLVSYFDETYVTGCIRTTPAGVRQLPPRFPPSTWNVCQATIDGSARTNNFAESWNNHLQQLVGHKHPSIWRLIEVLQCDTAEASARISRHVVGNFSV
jgi:hypothetical protein